MRYAPDFQFGPQETSRPLLYLILTTAVVSIVSTLLNGFFSYFFHMAGPQDWLQLSWYGIQNFFLWQPLTYLFTQTGGSDGISISYLISLSFNLYVLWILGSAVIDRVGLRSFFQLYFFSGILSGLVALAMMKFTNYYMALGGPGPALLALITFCTLLYSDVKIHLFLFFELKIKWLAALVFGAILLSALSHLDFVSFFFYLTAIVFGYLYGLIGYQLKSPFDFLRGFENFILRLFQAPSDETEAKIIDIKTGKAIDDDIFVDAMLTKISKTGKDSLTFYERKRLDEIAKRKNHP